jgi:hypothetical protein
MQQHSTRYSQRSTPKTRRRAVCRPVRKTHLSAVVRQPQQPHGVAAAAPRVPQRDARRPVAAAVVDDDDLVGERRALAVAAALEVAAGRGSAGGWAGGSRWSVRVRGEMRLVGRLPPLFLPASLPEPPAPTDPMTHSSVSSSVAGSRSSSL